MEFHQGGQVGKAHVIRAGGHAGHRAARPIASVYGDVQLGVFEIPFGSRHQEQGGWALKTPIQLEFDGRGLGRS